MNYRQPASEPVGIAIVGAGFIAESHADAIAQLAGLRLCSVVDRDIGAARRLAARHEVRAVGELSDAWDDQTQAVIVCTPNHTHVHLGMEVARAGRHLLMEKPLALSVEGARQLVDAFQRGDRQLLVGHTHRHTDYARVIHQTIVAGHIGTPLALRLSITGGWIWGGWGSWVLDPQLSGGHAFHNGVHLYDLASWWLGAPIVSVWAHGQRLTAADLGIDDYLSATLLTADGRSAVCDISRGERPRALNLFEVHVEGSAGSLTRTWSSDGITRFSDEYGGPLSAPGGVPFVRQLAVFRDAVTGHGPLIPQPQEAIAAVAVAEAVHAAAQSGDLTPVAIGSPTSEPELTLGDRAEHLPRSSEELE